MNAWAIWQWFVAFNPWIDARPIDVIGTPELDRAVARIVDDAAEG